MRFIERVRMPIAGLPPGPRTPSLVQTWQYLSRPIELFQTCQAHYGDTFTLRLAGMGCWVFVSKPEDVQAMFTGSPDTHEAGVVNAQIFGAITGSQTVLTLDGSAHLHQRRLVLPPFHGQRMIAYLDTIRDIAEAMVQAWPEDRPIKMHHHMQRATLNVIIRTVFGVDSPDDRLASLLTRLANDAVGSPLLLMPFLQWDLGPWSPWGRVINTVRDADHALYDEIKRRRADGEPREDIMSMLLRRPSSRRTRNLALGRTRDDRDCIGVDSRRARSKARRGREDS